MVDGAQGARQGRAAVHDDAPDNICYDWGHRRQGAVDAAFAKAAHVTKLEFVNNRLIPNAIEPRAAQRARTRAPTTATRSTSRTRTRTSSAC